MFEYFFRMKKQVAAKYKFGRKVLAAALKFKYFKIRKVFKILVN